MENVFVCVMLFIGIVMPALLIISVITYLGHVDVVKNENKPYDYVTFKTFLRVFNEYEQKYKINYYTDKSILSHGNQHYHVYINSDSICFDNKCMILYPLSYFRFKMWQYNKCKSKDRQKGLWEIGGTSDE